MLNGPCAASSGGRTRTPKDRTRTCCVADYTTPEGAAQRSGRVRSSRQARPSDTETDEGAVATEQMHRVEQRKSAVYAFDGGVERGHRLPRLQAELLDHRLDGERV